MRLLISIGVVIIFISVFFIFFTADGIVSRACTPAGGGFRCSMSDLGGEAFLGMVIIFLFVAIDIVTAYLVLSGAMKSGRVG